MKLSIRSLLQPHPCPFDGVNYVFQNFVYIFDCCNFKINGNNGPFPLLYLFIILCQLHHLI